MNREPSPLSINTGTENLWSLYPKEWEDVALWREATFYSIVNGVCVPDWIDAKPRLADAKQNAASVFPAMWNRNQLQQDNPRRLRCVRVRNYEPEFFTSVKGIETPAFNGEFKSAGEKFAMMQEAAQYAHGGLVQSFFSTGDRYFYPKPPLAYSLLGFAHVGYVVAVEWVGKLFMTAVSDPFALMSTKHTGVMSSLPKPEYAGKVAIPHDARKFVQCDIKEVGVMWTVEEIGGKFYKIIQQDAYEADQLVRIFTAYKAIRDELAILEAEDALPEVLSLLKDTKLLYGEFQLAVEMPFVDNPRHGDLSDDAVAQAVAEGVVWLAKHRLHYTDVRAPNVLVGEGNQVYLVDFDVRPLAEPVTTWEAYSSACKSVPGWVACRAVEVKVQELLESATVHSVTTAFAAM